VDAVELARALDFDLMAKHRRYMTPHFFAHSHPNWTVERAFAREDIFHIHRLTIATPGRILTQEEAVPDAGAATQGLMPAVRKHLLESPADIEAFITYQPPIDRAHLQDMRDTIARWRGIIGDSGVLAPWGWAGVFNFAADLMGIENLMTRPYEEPAIFHALMDRLSEAMATYNDALARAGADAIGIQGHIANAATVSPDYFRSYVQPHEKRVVEAIHAGGAFSIWHNCGCARSLYANYRETGFTVWETVAEAPRGDNTLAEAKQILGRDMVLLGNLDQVDFLKRATPRAVDERTRAILRTGKPGGRYIFACSDFLEKDTPMENVRAMLSAAREEGRYD
jgi:uroporphyrinogen-III decarboxylase